MSLEHLTHIRQVLITVMARVGSRSAYAVWHLFFLLLGRQLRKCCTPDGRRVDSTLYLPSRTVFYM